MFRWRRDDRGGLSRRGADPQIGQYICLARGCGRSRRRSRDCHLLPGARAQPRAPGETRALAPQARVSANASIAPNNVSWPHGRLATADARRRPMAPSILAQGRSARSEGRTDGEARRRRRRARRAPRDRGVRRAFRDTALRRRAGRARTRRARRISRRDDCTKRAPLVAAYAWEAITLQRIRACWRSFVRSWSRWLSHR